MSSHICGLEPVIINMSFVMTPREARGSAPLQKQQEDFNAAAVTEEVSAQRMVSNSAQDSAAPESAPPSAAAVIEEVCAAHESYAAALRDAARSTANSQACRAALRKVEKPEAVDHAAAATARASVSMPAYSDNSAS